MSLHTFYLEFECLLKRNYFALTAGNKQLTTDVPCLYLNFRVASFYAPRKNLGEHIVAALSVRPSVSQSVRPSVRPSVRQSVRPYVPNSCPAHNFVIWSRIFKLFHRNDHHSARMCRAQQLGLYLEGQGHSMTLHQNHVRPITLLFEVGF